MREEKRERLEITLQKVARRWGTPALVRAGSATIHASGFSTGFATLDHLLGASGVPRYAPTVLSGPTTCGKLTLAYKILSQTQHPAPMEQRHPVAILDLGATTDCDYVARCGVDLDQLLLVRPSSGQSAVRVLLDLVRSRQLRAILVDSLPYLATDPETARFFDQTMHQINLSLKGGGCALLLIDEADPPWLPELPMWPSRAVRHYAALSIEFVWEGWIESEGDLIGYRAQAHLVKNRGPRTGQSASVSVEFGQTVRAGETW